MTQCLYDVLVAGNIVYRRVISFLSSSSLWPLLKDSTVCPYIYEMCLLERMAKSTMIMSTQCNASVNPHVVAYVNSLSLVLPSRIPLCEYAICIFVYSPVEGHLHGLQAFDSYE